ncbi:MAG: ABC transporter substrate-binding protein [Ktedonobacterales bacterium]
MHRRASRSAVWLSLATLLGAFSLLMSGCSFGASSQTVPLPPAQQVLRMGLDTNYTDVSTLDPAQASNFDAGTGFIISLIFPPLLTTDDHLNPEPWAAASMPTFDAHTNTYTFHVRPGLKWSDGTPIDADTYAYSLNRSLSPCTSSPNAYYLYPIQDAQAYSTETCTSGGTAINGKIQTLVGGSLLVPDSQTLVIKLTAPAPYLLAALTTPIAFAQPEQLIDQYGPEDWSQHLTGNGGFGGNLYRVKSWDHTGHLDLMACLSSCGAGRLAAWGQHAVAPHLRELDFSFYQTAGDEQVDYQAGHVDVASFLSASYGDSSKGSTFVEVPTLQITSLQFNWAMAPFDDLRVRQAFALALDKDTLANVLGLIPTNHIVPQGMPGYDPNLLGPDETTKTTGNIALARRLLQSYADDQCGGSLSQCPPVTVLYGGSFCDGGGDPVILSYELKAVQMWQQAFPGYPIRGPFTGGDCLLPDLNNSAEVPQAFTAFWTADYADPQDWLSLQFGPAAINNFGSVNVPTANMMMAEADQELDSSQRTALYNEAEQLLVTNVAWIPIGQALAYFDVRYSVAGFALTALGYPSLDQIYSIQLLKR